MSIETEIEERIEARVTPLREEIERLRTELSVRAEFAHDGELESLRAAIVQLETAVRGAESEARDAAQAAQAAA